MIDPLLLKIFTYAFSPVVIIAPLAIFWARQSNSPRLAYILQMSTLFWTLWLCAVSAYFILAVETCRSIQNYSYSDCPLVPDAIGAVIFNMVIVSYLSAAIYVMILILIGVIIEFRATRNRTSPPPHNPLEG